MTKTLVQQYEEARAAYWRSYTKRPQAAITERLRIKMANLMFLCLADWNRRAA